MPLGHPPAGNSLERTVHMVSDVCSASDVTSLASWFFVQVRRTGSRPPAALHYRSDVSTELAILARTEIGCRSIAEQPSILKSPTMMHSFSELETRAGRSEIHRLQTQARLRLRATLAVAPPRSWRLRPLPWEKPLLRGTPPESRPAKLPPSHCGSMNSQRCPAPYALWLVLPGRWRGRLGES